MNDNALLVGALALAACGGSSSSEPLLPAVAEATFVVGINNPYMPLPPGKRWVYESMTDEGIERIEITVTAEAKVINGVTAVVVRDTARLDGVLKEDTRDWFAQDAAGNVWYLGEDTCVYENDVCVSTEGSWEWGKDGALPGIAMPASPTIDGRVYRQEYYRGHAEDTGEVIAVNVAATTPAVTSRDCIRTHDASTLDLSLDEEKTYCRGVGLTLTVEGDVVEQLIQMSGP